MATSKDVTMRRFVLVREEDVSGTSGTGVVAEGVEYSNGQVAIHWISQLESIAIYASMKILEQIHGHGGRSKVEWVDPSPEQIAARFPGLHPSMTGPMGRKQLEELHRRASIAQFPPLIPVCPTCKDVGYHYAGTQPKVCSCPAGEMYQIDDKGQISMRSPRI